MRERSRFKSGQVNQIGVGLRAGGRVAPYRSGLQLTLQYIWVGNLTGKVRAS